MPALHAAVIDGEGGVGDDQLLVDADDASEPFARGTGPEGGIEREHIVVRLFKTDAVGLKSGREVVGDPGGENHQLHIAVALIEGGFAGVGEPADCVLGTVNSHTVDDQTDSFRCFLCFSIPFFIGRMCSQPVFNAYEVAAGIDAGIALLQFHLKLLLYASAFNDMKRRKDAELCPFRVGFHFLNHILYGMMFHFFA